MFTTNPTPSIASILGDTITDMKSQLETAITTSVFLDIEGKTKEIFEQCYTNFVTSVRKMEGYICNYLAVSGEHFFCLCVCHVTFSVVLIKDY